MRLSGRLSAAIEILSDFDTRRVPLKTAIADWARGARYAGAKDRAWISGLCLDALRRRNSLAEAMGDVSPRALALGVLRFLWNADADAIAEAAAEEPHGPGALTDGELGVVQSTARTFHKPEAVDAVSASSEGGAVSALHIAGDFPEWLTANMQRAFGDRVVEECAALTHRADIDLRINTLKTTPEKAMAALRPVKAEAAPYLANAARILAPDPSEKAPGVTVIPAFNKGWVEVQDLGSQIAAACAGDVKGRQVLDFCAGGGGKTLALAAMMENTGQLYAYDSDARRLKPLYDRARRAGVRNLQVINPSTDRAALDGLKNRMDVVFVDAPCTGSGTWRRHPDTKWRLTPQQLERRTAEQDAVLREAAPYVKSGGRLVYVVCSVFCEEGEDRIAAFLEGTAEFTPVAVSREANTSGLLTQDGQRVLAQCGAAAGAVRLTPALARTDGFFITVLERKLQDHTHDA